jgi:hypothetical protein
VNVKSRVGIAHKNPDMVGNAHPTQKLDLYCYLRQNQMLRAQ